MWYIDINHYQPPIRLSAGIVDGDQFVTLKDSYPIERCFMTKIKAEQYLEKVIDEYVTH